MIANAIFSLGFASALAYQCILRAPVSALRSVLKTASLGCVGIALWLDGAAALPLLALALSVFGDFALSREGDRWFLAGLGGFLLAHVVYAALFWGLFSAPDLRWEMVAAIVILAASTPLWLLPRTGALRGPVLAYILTISGMGILAGGLPPEAYFIVWGAALFIGSDAFLALNLFVASDRAIFAYLVWPLYVVGQVLIQIGLLA